MPTPNKKQAVSLRIVDSQTPAVKSVTLPSLRTLSVGAVLAGVPRQKLEDGLSQFFGDRFTVEEVSEEPAKPASRPKAKSKASKPTREEPVEN